MFLTALLAFAVTELSAQQVPPFELPPNVELNRDVVYATIGTRQLLLDLFLPRQGAGPFPAVVYIHGGGWSGGNKNAFQRQAAYMATKGFVGACIQYRLSGEAQYPAALHDAKAAVRWLRANAKEYKIRVDRIGAAGGSAGGHLAALLGTTGDDPAYEGSVGVTGQSSRVQAVAAFNPAVDLVSLAQPQPAKAAGSSLTQFFGKTYREDPDLYARASPLQLVTSKAPPFLFLHGDADTTVPYQESVDMRKALLAAGVKAEIMTAEGATHTFFNRPPWYELTLQRMEQFFVHTLGQSAGGASHSR